MAITIDQAIADATAKVYEIPNLTDEQRAQVLDIVRAHILNVQSVPSIAGIANHVRNNPRHVTGKNLLQ